MNYIYDVLLNFTDLYSYYEYYEWEKDDHLINVRKLPIFKVSSDVISDFINYKVIVDNSFIKLIDKKCLLYKKDINYVSNIIILSNGEKSMGVSFDKKGRAIYLSSMLIDEEEDANRIVNNKEITKMSYRKAGVRNNNVLRKDIFKKKKIQKEFRKEFQNREYDKLRFFYYEVFDSECDDINFVYKKLMSSDDDRILNLLNYF